MPKPKQTRLPWLAHQLAANQANSFGEQALKAANSSGAKIDPGDALAYLVNASLAIELYIKAIMIFGRQGLLTTGHDLQALVAEFPPSLLTVLRQRYDQHPSAKTQNVRLFSLKLAPRDAVVAAPSTAPYERSYASFDEAITSLAGVFVRARYFFEELAGADWAIFDYPTHAIEGVLLALEWAYSELVAGKLNEVLETQPPRHS